MKYSATVLIAMVAAVCLIGCTDAWGSSSGNRGRGTWGANSSRPSRTYLLVRRVDEPHPYFRIFNVSANSSLAELKSRLGEFFKKPAQNITMLVKNDELLMTGDIEARMLKLKDRLEVTFSDSGAPTRSKTQYAYSKDARRSKWLDKKSDKKDSKKKDRRERPTEAGGRGRLDRDERRRRPENREAESDADADETMAELDFF